MRHPSSSIRPLAGVLLAASLVAPTAGAQRTTGSSATPAPTCSGAWTGNITYTLAHDRSETKTVGLVTKRGKETRTIGSSSYYYASVAVIEEPGNPGSSIGKASIHSLSRTLEDKLTEERNTCGLEKTPRVMSGRFEHQSQVRGQATNQEAEVGVGVNADGTYTVTVSLPEILGLASGFSRSTLSGQCVPMRGWTTHIPPTSESIPGNEMRSGGSDRIDSSNPNSVSGSYHDNVLGISRTISWNLQKCGAALRITDVQFEDMKFPNRDDWRQIGDIGTIDGNLIRIRAKILNASGDAKTAAVRFKEIYRAEDRAGASTDKALKDGLESVRIEPNSEESVELVWDSSGYAWFDDARPRRLQRIAAELEEDGRKIDELARIFKIAPKPLVLVHGLWSNWRAWESWQALLTATHSAEWKAFPVGEVRDKGVMNTGNEFMSSEPTFTIAENARELQGYVRFAQEDRNAWHVDIVAHSMGGLISRYYINDLMERYAEDPRPRVSHLIMLGTPNLGSPCADLMGMGFEVSDKRVEAIRQLRPRYLKEFNSIVTRRKGVKFAALAGSPLPVFCQWYIWNDGVVSVRSAKYIFKDTGESSSLHTDLTSASDFAEFVRPRLAVGPAGNHSPELPDPSEMRSGLDSRRGGTFRLVDVAARDREAASATSAEVDPRPDFAKAVRLSPRQAVEVDLPVERASNFGLTFMADPQVSATLVHEDGRVVGKNLAGTPEARPWFRSMFFDKPTTKATWKLKLENTGDRELEAVVVTWSNALK